MAGTPLVQPVEKERATPQVRALLEDIQDTMGIPWPPANWRSYAMYPPAMRLIWERLRPSVATEQFLEDALRISGFAYQRAGSWYRPRYRLELPGGEQARIEWELDAFEFGNPQLLIQQAAISRALRGQTVGRQGTAQPRQAPSAYRRPEIRMVDEQEAPDEVKGVYRDLKETLAVPVISSDYQALAVWPAFLRRAWEDARQWLQREEYERLLMDLSLMAAEAAGRLSPPLRLEEHELQALLPDRGDQENLRRLVQTFTHLLPGLIANDALFRVGVAGGRPVPAPPHAGAPAPGERLPQR